MAVVSAGILIYRLKPGLQVLLAHPGGPFWKNRDEGAWSVPKGEIKEGENLLRSAKREFAEEVGFTPEGTFIDLGSITQKGGKVVFCYALEYDLPDHFVPESNSFETEWPPHSGKKKTFPEIDRIKYFCPEEAKKKINPSQAAFISRLMEKLGEC